MAVPGVRQQRRGCGMCRESWSCRMCRESRSCGFGGWMRAWGSHRSDTEGEPGVLGRGWGQPWEWKGGLPHRRLGFGGAPLQLPLSLSAAAALECGPGTAPTLEKVTSPTPCKGCGISSTTPNHHPNSSLPNPHHPRPVTPTHDPNHSSQTIIPVPYSQPIMPNPSPKPIIPNPPAHLHNPNNDPNPSAHPDPVPMPCQPLPALHPLPFLLSEDINPVSPSKEVKSKCHICGDGSIEGIDCHGEYSHFIHLLSPFPQAHRNSSNLVTPHNNTCSQVLSQQLRLPPAFLGKQEFREERIRQQNRSDGAEM